MAIINSSNSTATIGTDSVVISEQKTIGQRTRLIITNIGATNISVSTGNSATAGSGIMLYPGGSISWERDGTFPIQQDRVFAISSAAGGTLAIYEEVLN